MNKRIIKKLILAILLIGIGVVSFTVLSKIFSDPDTYEKLIMTLDEKKANVIKLTAGTSTASVAISALPSDLGTPVASQLADLSKYMLIILTAVYLEKYLLTVIGFIVFRFIIPLGCLLGLYETITPWGNHSLRKVIVKLAVFSVMLMSVIPVSVMASDLIDKTYEESISEVMEKTEDEVEIPEEVQEETAPATTDGSFWTESANYIVSKVDDVKEFFTTAGNKITTSVSDAMKTVKESANVFIEATAVMIVTSCVMPIITIILLLWLSKIILEIDLPKRKALPAKEESTSIERQ